MPQDLGASAKADQALAVPVEPVARLDPSGFDPSRGLFNYSVEQHENIRRGDHPDCCVGDVCSYCGASESNYLPCAGLQSQLAHDLFQLASAKARNANVRSIGQETSWEAYDHDARLLDRAARAIAAAARQGGDVEQAPGEAPQSGGDSRIAQHGSGG